MLELLVVDDDPNSRKIIELMLSNQGYRLHFAEDGLEALDLFAREKIGLVLLDLLMPRLDGFETAKRLKEMGDVPIVAISALAFATDRQEALEAGCDDFLTKPFARRSLIETITRHSLRRQALA
jgi:CheY-like chemotaxis protein